MNPNELDWTKKSANSRYALISIKQYDKSVAESEDLAQLYEYNVFSKQQECTQKQW